MLYPKKSDQFNLIGQRVKFTGDLVRCFYKNGNCRWKAVDNTRWKREGKIVGFGCTYNGAYSPGESYDGFFDNVPTFLNKKRVLHVKVRMTGEGKELKVPPSTCTLIKE